MWVLHQIENFLIIIKQALSFEFISNGAKVLTNSGYHASKNIKLNELSRSSASHNVLTIDDNSSCKFKKKIIQS